MRVRKKWFDTIADMARYYKIPERDQENVQLLWDMLRAKPPFHVGAINKPKGDKGYTRVLLFFTPPHRGGEDWEAQIDYHRFWGEEGNDVSISARCR
jgi:hypothetical protein